MKHPEDGPVRDQDVKAAAARILADPKHHGRSDQLERTRNDPLAGHDETTTLDPAWRKSGDDWIHEEEG